MSRIVTALVADGLVTRVKDGGDARAVRIEPTAEGRKLLWEGRRRRVSRVASALARLDAGEFTRIADAVELLHRMLADGAARASPDAGGGRRTAGGARPRSAARKKRAH